MRRDGKNNPFDLKVEIAILCVFMALVCVAVRIANDFHFQPRNRIVSEGATDARRNLQSGEFDCYPELALGEGYPECLVFEEYLKILRDKYRIGSRDYWAVKYAKRAEKALYILGYNEAVTLHMKERHGRDIFAESYEEARDVVETRLHQGR
ncbi:MAG: hypothetical protein ACYTHM_05570 [Planctomycetota bacterium]|jgi:hypothetical protein